jgi:hypothetical protein
MQSKSSLPLHPDSAIHDARPDIVAAAHCHSLYGKSWSAFGRPIDILQQDGCLFHDNLSVYANYGGIVLAAEEGGNIAAALGPKHMACILQNHGLLTRMWSLSFCYRMTLTMFSGDDSWQDDRRMRLSLRAPGQAVPYAATCRSCRSQRHSQVYRQSRRRGVYGEDERVLGNDVLECTCTRCIAR